MIKMLHVQCFTCHMSHMLHVTNDSRAVYIKGNMDRCLLGVSYIFWKAHAKYSSMVMIKMLLVKCVICHMSHMLHVTNINLQRFLPKTQCVIYFWKAHAKCSSILMLRTLHINVGKCYTCYM